jgi:hypothetical protein
MTMLAKKLRASYILRQGSIHLRDKAFDAPKNVFNAPKKYNYRTKNDQKIFLRFNAPKSFYF